MELIYRQFWVVASTVGQLPPDRWRATLAAVAADPLLSQLLDGLAEQRARGTVQYGTVVPRPTVVELRPTRASIIDCQDASRSGEVDPATGVVRTVGAARTPVAAVVQRDTAGRWRVTDARYLPGQC